MRHAHVFGAKGVYLVPTADRQKLDDHTRDCIFLGALQKGDGVKVMDVSSKRIIKTRDAFFEEHNPLHEKQDTSPATHVKSSASPWLYPENDNGNHTDLSHGIANPDIPAEGNQAPREEPILHHPRRNRLAPERYGNLRAHSATVLNTPTYKLAINSSDSSEWRKAMTSEIEGFIKRKVFTLVPKPQNRKIISCRWHLKRKLNPDGSLNKFKARLLARGFTQREGIDYKETFAPSSRQESIKAFLAVNGHRDWEVIQLDVVGAFLYGDLNKEIYLTQPEGFVDENYPDHVWKLNSSLYGLKQSARQWHHCLTEHLNQVGFSAAQVDPSMFILRRNDVAVATMIVHVDDILLSGTKDTVKEVEKHLQRKFDLTRNEEVSSFLSFDINRDRKNRTFSMNQASYVMDLVETYHLENARPVHTPCDDHFKELRRNADPDLVTSHPYCSMIGALLWLSNGTRPDITFAVN